MSDEIEFGWKDFLFVCFLIVMYYSIHNYMEEKYGWKIIANYSDIKPDNYSDIKDGDWYIINKSKVNLTL